jgi:sugar phosphate isomerase/epimerase
MTTKPWTLAQAIENYKRAGIPGITVWRQHLEPQGPTESGRMLRESGLNVVSLCRGGFFPAPTKEGRNKAIDDNLRAIDEAAVIGAPLIVLVCGAVPGISLPEARKQIQDGIEACIPRAAALGVKLAIEPLHPMYASDRSAVNSLASANDMAEAIGHPNVGVTIDVYHLWWDPALEREIARAGCNILSYHVCDWRVPTRDFLNDRGMMGQGCINLGEIRTWVESTGYDGPIEVEIFSDEFWAKDQGRHLEDIKAAYLRHV